MKDQYDLRLDLREPPRGLHHSCMPGDIPPTTGTEGCVQPDFQENT